MLRARLLAIFGAVLTMVVAVGIVGAATPPKPKTVRISAKPSGAEVPGSNAEYASMSASGRFTVFETDARLVPKDEPDDIDVYLYDRKLKRHRLISVKSDGTDGTGVQAAAAEISPDGRFVCFGVNGELSDADTNDIHDVYRRDRERGKTILISRTDTGTQLNGVNDDSELCGVSNSGVVAWESEGAFVSGDTNDDADIFVRNPKAGTTVRATVDDQGNELPSGGEIGKDARVALSGNGRFVAFQSFDAASGGTDTAFGGGMDSDVFVRDLAEGRTSWASVNSAEQEALSNDNANSRMPGISGGGRFVVFQTDAPFTDDDDNATYDIYVRDRREGVTFRASVRSNESEATPPGLPNQYPEISPNGRFVVWDTSGNYGGGADAGDFRDVYRRDIVEGKTRLISLTAGGGRADGNQLADTANGRWVAFQTMSKMTARPDDGMDWDVFLRGPLRP